MLICQYWNCKWSHYLYFNKYYMVNFLSKYINSKKAIDQKQTWFSKKLIISYERTESLNIFISFKKKIKSE